MFYDRLVALCRMNSTNITEVAVTHLHVASSAPAGWKKGASPRSDVVIRAAEYFGVTADYLLGLTDVPTPLTATEVSPEVQAVAVKLTAASDTARKAAVAAMNAIISAIDA